MISLTFPVLSEHTENEPVRCGQLKIRINGFQNENGTCRFALDNSGELYESNDSVFIGKILKIQNYSVVISIDSLAFGEYAIKVFHDENNNGKLDKNFLGIPSEAYGYSNNASGWFGPPSWEDAKFYFGVDRMEKLINID